MKIIRNHDPKYLSFLLYHWWVSLFRTKKKWYFSTVERFMEHFSSDKYSYEYVQCSVERTIEFIEIQVFDEVWIREIITSSYWNFNTRYNSETFMKHLWLYEYAEKRISSKSVSLMVISIVTNSKSSQLRFCRHSFTEWYLRIERKKIC